MVQYYCNLMREFLITSVEDGLVLDQPFIADFDPQGVEERRAMEGVRASGFALPQLQHPRGTRPMPRRPRKRASPGRRSTMTPKVLGALDVAVHVAKAAGAARVAELVKASDFDDEQRIVFSLRGIIVGKDEHGEPVTAPVVVPPDGTFERRQKDSGGCPRLQAADQRFIPHSSACRSLYSRYFRVARADQSVPPPHTRRARRRPTGRIASWRAGRRACRRASTSCAARQEKAKKQGSSGACWCLLRACR